MPQQSISYALILVVSGFIAAILLYLVWDRRRSPGAAPMIVWLLALIVWPWTYALHWLFPTEPTQFFWLNATYFGIVAVPAAFFVFTLQLTHNDSWLSKSNLWLFLIEPILTLVLLWTDPWHGLFFGGKRLYGTSDIFEGGPWFW
ncbi:MAG: hypothetical protein GYA59_06615, partial [Chloroflexi bacterium]|nr:hypothetical protein [Chloroflexota bacterium]